MNGILLDWVDFDVKNMSINEFLWNYVSLGTEACKLDLKFQELNNLCANLRKEILLSLYGVNFHNFPTGKLHNFDGYSDLIHKITSVTNIMEDNYRNADTTPLEYHPEAKGHPCCHTFSAGETIIRCKDCAIDETCVLCEPCFDPSQHVSHRLDFTISAAGGGICDCGDLEAWKTKLVCKFHTSSEEDKPNQWANYLPDKLKTSLESGTRVILKFITEVFGQTHPKLYSEKDTPALRDISKTFKNPFPDEPLFKFENPERCDLILWNDEIHSYQEVTEALTNDLLIDITTAKELTRHVDTFGRIAISDRCAYISEHPLETAKKFHQRGLKVNVQHYQSTVCQHFAANMLHFLLILAKGENSALGTEFKELVKRIIADLMLENCVSNSWPEEPGKTYTKSQLSSRVHMLKTANVPTHVVKTPFTNEDGNIHIECLSCFSEEESQLWRQRLSSCVCHQEWEPWSKFKRPNIINSSLSILIRQHTFLWKNARIDLTELLHCVFLTDYQRRAKFAQVYFECYMQMIQQIYSDDSETHLSLLSMSVQIFTVPSIANSLMEHGFVHLLQHLLYSLEAAKCLSNPSNPSDFVNTMPLLPLWIGVQSTVEDFIISQQLLTDLYYIITSTNSWNDPNDFNLCIKQWIELLSLFEGTESMQRARHQHAEYDFPTFLRSSAILENLVRVSDAYVLSQKLQNKFDIGTIIQYAIIFLECHANQRGYSSLRCFSNLNDYILPDSSYSFEKLSIWASNSFLLDTMSIYNPLTWFLGLLYSRFEYDSSYNCAYWPNQESYSIAMYKIMQTPLRTLSWLSQVPCKLWIRNEQARMETQAQHYVVSFNRGSGLEMELSLVQKCANSIPPAAFILAVTERFLLKHSLLHICPTLDQVFEQFPKSENTFLDLNDSQLAQMTLGAAVLLKVILTEHLLYEYNSDTSRLRIELIHMLYIKPRSYSELESLIKESETVSLKSILNEVATFSINGRKLPALYHLKDQHACEIDLFYYKNSAHDREIIVQHVIDRSRNQPSIEIHIPEVKSKRNAIFNNIDKLWTSEILAFIWESWMIAASLDWFKYENSVVAVVYTILIGFSYETIQKDFLKNCPNLLTRIAKVTNIAVEIDAHSVTAMFLQMFWEKSALILVTKMEKEICETVLAKNFLAKKISNGQQNSCDSKVIAHQKKAQAFAILEQQRQAFAFANKEFSLSSDDCSSQDECSINDMLNTVKNNRSFECVTCHTRIQNHEKFGLVCYISDTNLNAGWPLKVPESSANDWENWYNLIETSTCYDRERVLSDDIPITLATCAPKNHASNVLVSTCGHVIHNECYLQLIIREENTILNNKDPLKEFYCPLCRRFSNLCLDMTYMSGRETGEEAITKAHDPGFSGNYWLFLRKNNFPDHLSLATVISITTGIFPAHIKFSAFVTLLRSTLNCIEVASRGMKAMVPRSGTYVTDTISETNKDLLSYIFAGIKYYGQQVASHKIWRTAYEQFNVSIDPFLLMASQYDALCHNSTLFMYKEHRRYQPQMPLFFTDGLNVFCRLLGFCHNQSKEAFGWALRFVYSCEILKISFMVNQYSPDLPPGKFSITYSEEELQSFQNLFYRFLNAWDKRLDSEHKKKHSNQTSSNKLESLANKIPLIKQHILIFLRRLAIIAGIADISNFQSNLKASQECNNLSEIERLQFILELPTIDAQINRILSFNLQYHENRLLRPSLNMVQKSYKGVWLEEFSSVAMDLSLSWPGYLDIVKLPDRLDQLLFHDSCTRSEWAIKCHGVGPAGGPTCIVCQTIPTESALCLLCGVLCCHRTACCSQDPFDECWHHLTNCDGHAGLFLIVERCRVLMTDRKRSAYIQAPYVDVNGETDTGYLRRRPMFLDKTRYNELRSLWHNHEICNKLHNLDSDML